MQRNLWAAYVARVSTGPQTDIAKRVGVNQATISRWRTGKEVPVVATKVAAFSRAFGRSPLEGFVAAGMLEEDEARKGLSTSQRRLLADLRGSMLSGGD